MGIIQLEQKYHTPLALSQTKINDPNSYVKGLAQGDIYESYWKKNLNSTASTENNDDDNELLEFIHV